VNGPASSGDEAALASYATALADEVDERLPSWVARSVARFVTIDDPAVAARVEQAGQAARAEVMPSLRALLAQDVDAQRNSPLAILRRAVRYPTEVLGELGVPPVRRDEFVERNFPDDVYDLSPASFADVDPSLHEPGIAWGAAKAHVVLQRRRAEGKR
jgi:hypothetical protein